MLRKIQSFLSTIFAGRAALHVHSLDDSISVLNGLRSGNPDEFFACNGPVEFIHVGYGGPNCIAAGYQSPDGREFTLDGEPTANQIEELLRLMYDPAVSVLDADEWIEH